MADEIGRALQRVPAWTRASGPDRIERELRFGTFAEAVSFVVRVALLAEKADHHPDMDLRWNRVRVSLSTHDAGGVTQKDVSLAERVDGVAAGWARE
jgi:4a-hydroxytetrahydrobiopterin dehydratase